MTAHMPLYISYSIVNINFLKQVEAGLQLVFAIDEFRKVNSKRVNCETVA